MRLVSLDTQSHGVQPISLGGPRVFNEEGFWDNVEVQVVDVGVGRGPHE